MNQYDNPEVNSQDLDELEEEREEVPYRYAITSYGADYPVDSLVKRLREESIFVPPFQRKYVWDLPRASKFVESLLLGLPVPGIFLAKDQQSSKLLVVDGQQRLQTLLYFYDGIFGNSGKEFALKALETDFNGLTYKTLSEDDARRLDDSIIHATVIRQDEPSDDESSIYKIFERLNTGGVQLAPQEIRASIYHGPFSELLGTLNKNAAWRDIFGPVHKNMRDQELILRFFAFYYDGATYKRPMKGFLNTYMGRNRSLSHHPLEELVQLFTNTIETVLEMLGAAAFRRTSTLNAAIFDSMMCGIAGRLNIGPITNFDEARQAYTRLLNDPDYIEATETGTSGDVNVKKRLAMAMEAFANVR